LKKELKILERSKISDRNKNLILKYMNYRLADGVSVARVHREIVSLRLLCEKFDVELEELDEDSLVVLLAKIETYGWKPATVNEYKRDLRMLLRMIGKNELADKIRVRDVKDNDLTREDLLTVEEVLKLISVAANHRDPALIMCHLDLGCRPEELLTLRVGDFERDSYGIRVHIRRSKTTRRSPHLSFSIPYVVRWLEVHPLRDDPDAPMWLDLYNFNKRIVKPIDIYAYNRILDKLFRKAGIQKRKRFSPYKFRHTSITMWSAVLTEQELVKRSGHVVGSKALRRYAKLVDIDTDKKILKELGLLSEEEAEPEVKKLKPVQCNLCGEFNEPHRQRCWKCKAVLDPLKLAKEVIDEEIVEAVIDEPMHNQMKEKLKQMIKQILAEEGLLP